MKKMFMMLALCLMCPAVGMAEGLPAFLDTVQEGLSEGLALGAEQAAQELTLEFEAESDRIESGETITLKVKAGNPRPVDTAVHFSLELPERLGIGDAAQWDAILPAAEMNGEKFVPSETVFEKKLTLLPGGASEKTEIECEMSMGTRFYRARMPLALCVPNVKAEARMLGAPDGRLTPGSQMIYEIKVTNDGTAEKTVEVDLTLPEGMTLPEGGSTFKANVLAKAAQAGEKTEAVVRLPIQIDEHVLDEDEDAMRLLAGQLRVDGARVPLPRVQVCGPKITARLLPEMDNLRAGQEMGLRLMVVNTGLAEADVQLSCVLPHGLTLVEEERTPGEADKRTPDDDETPHAAPVLAENEEEPPMRREKNTLIFDVHMDAATERAGGVDANTRVIDLKVRADEPHSDIKEQLLGTTLAWKTDEGQTNLGQSAAVRVYRPVFADMDKADWHAIFWAGLLLVVTVFCLYAAVGAERKRDEYNFD